MEFAGARLTAELVQGEQVVNILPKDGRINAFRNLKKPETKSELRSYCGMLASLQAWTPSIKHGSEYPIIEESLLLKWKDKLEPRNGSRISGS